MTRRCTLFQTGTRWAFAGWAVSALTAGAFAAPGDVSFTKDIAPILAKKCVTCHGPEKAKGNYQLHNFESLLKPGASKDAPVTPGQPAKSEMFRLLVTTDADDRMPQKDDPLPKTQIALIEKWIQQGAKFDGPDAKAHLASLIPRVPHPNPPASYARPVPVAALTFSPDGRQLAASGYHEVTLWEPATGKLLGRVKNLPQRIQALAWHPSGQWLAVGGGSPGQSGEIALVDVAKGAVAKVLASTIDTVMALAFDKDGSRLAAGGADNAIRILSVPDGKELRLLQQHADWVLGLAFSPDGKHLASASRDRTARVFNLDTGDLEASYMGHEAPVSGVAFTEDGKTVYSCGRDKDVHYWAAKDAKKGGKISGAEGELFRVLLTDGQVFSCGADAQVRQHKLDDRSLVRALSGHGDRVYALTAHAPGKWLASGAHNGEVRVWNWEDGKPVASFIAAPR
ncbi:MAG: c-type cytochrome domain-containing protein [Limisphaerales bacterium]